MPRAHNQGAMHVCGSGRRTHMARAGGSLTAAQQLIARMTVSPDATRLGHIETLVSALEAAGVWNKLDCLYVLAAHDAKAARLNWKSDAYNLTESGSPTFAADLGYTGDATGAYLNTGFNPSLHGNTSQDSAHFGGWVTANNADIATDALGGSVATYILPYRSGKLWAKLNQAGTAPQATVAGALGHSAISRTSATTQQIYRDGMSILTDSTASSAEEDLAYYLLARSNGSGGTSFTARTLGAAHFGTGLTDVEHSDLYDALSAYMTAVGAV